MLKSALFVRLKQVESVGGEQRKDQQREQVCSMVKSFAQRASTGTSVGDKAVLVLNARNK